ncbi:ATP-binding cassette domain-containing protein [Nakamurella sp. YIM 132087]|uniref:ATP-binding cassette domain-containing protein n=1 Tax=Nakamurella alba TaxID=2665158 RepID=A0A7K1FPV7_9ACTN|nr:ABC transporter ATP-binding protein [Nakamurella alba]MTD16161.1 ATP-binding cassette domain-containing protein [Nakamurella alba]
MRTVIDKTEGSIVPRSTAPAAPPGGPGPATAPVVELSHAALSFGDRVLWSDLDLSIPAGQFVAVLGANGAGKTSLLKVLLGELPLSGGTARIAGRPVRRGNDRIGYVPQRVGIDGAAMVKARDVVRLGRDGHRWGPSFQIGRARRETRSAVDDLLESVGASAFADAPVGMLSGGELQRVRIAEALAGDPDLLILDEPLAALDLARQHEVAELMDRRRRDHGTSVIFVTHEINAVIDHVDQILYLAGGRFRIGPVAEVMTSQSLSELYGAPVDVIDAHGRLVVVAANDMTAGMHQSVDDHFPHDPDVHDHGAHHPADHEGWRLR